MDYVMHPDNRKMTTWQLIRARKPSLEVAPTNIFFILYPSTLNAELELRTWTRKYQVDPVCQISR